MVTYWNVKRKENRTYTLWPDGGEKASVPAFNETELRQQMTSNSIFDEWQESVLRQLARCDVARVVVPKVGQFSQGMP
jgi:hypothetical protein